MKSLRARFASLLSVQAMFIAMIAALMTRAGFTRLPFVNAMQIGVAGMPTRVVMVCSYERGIEHTQPWRARSQDGLARRVTTLFSRVRDAVSTSWRGSPLSWQVAAAAVLVLAVVFSHQTDVLAAFPVAMAPTGLKALRQQSADLRVKMEANLTERMKPSATTEQKATLKSEYETLKAQFAEVSELLAEAESLNEAARLAPTPEPGGDAAASAAATTVVQTGQDLSAQDPKRGFRDHKDYLTAVMNAGRGMRVDARLVPLRAAQGSDEQGVYNDAVGGFLVPHGVAPGVLSIAPQDDPILPMCTAVQMDSPTVSFNARVDKDHTTSVSGGFVVTRRPETVDGSASRAKFEQVTLVANEEFGLAFATERILTDSAVSFISIIQAGFRDEYVANGMRERISGTGSGERQGILNAGCKISIAKENGQAAATIQKENIDKMAARCWRYGRAVWIANHQARPQLKSLVQIVGTGGNSVPYFVTDGAPAGFDGLLDGRPLVFSEFAEVLGTEGDLMLIVPSEYLEGTYQSEQYAESIHVRFVSAEKAFRFYRRNDGQWWWKSALTPRKGSTLSPVVTLATRG